MKYKLVCNNCECDDFEEFNEIIECESINKDEITDWATIRYDIKCKNCGNQIFYEEADLCEIKE